MNTYAKNRNYRKIYEKYYGPIPRDEKGRSMEIHHIDGNHYNNNIENLKLVTIEEHYQIHYDQGDYGAAYLIAGKMTLTPEEQSDLAKKSNLKRIIEGTHNWLNGAPQRKRLLKLAEQGLHPWQNEEHKRKQSERMIKKTLEGNNPFSGGKIQSETNKRRLEEGTHNFLNKTESKKRAQKRLKNGNHHWLTETHKEEARQRSYDSLKKGTHPSQIVWTCEDCGKTGKGKGNFTQHTDRWCRLKK